MHAFLAAYNDNSSDEEEERHHRISSSVNEALPSAQPLPSSTLTADEGHAADTADATSASTRVRSASVDRSLSATASAAANHANEQTSSKRARLQLPAPFAVEDTQVSAQEGTPSSDAASGRQKRRRLNKSVNVTSNVSVPAASTDAHQGRNRSFPHVENQWAVHVFIPLYFDASAAESDEEQRERMEQTVRRALQQREEVNKRSTAPTVTDRRWHLFFPQPSNAATVSVRTPPYFTVLPTATAAGDATAAAVSTSSSAATATATATTALAPTMHISLSRTVTLRYAQIDGFISVLNSSLMRTLRATNATATTIVFGTSDAIILVNDDRTRSFFALRAPDTSTKSADDTTVQLPSLLLTLINAVDQVFTAFDLQTYYSPPLLHASVAWCLGDVSGEAAATNDKAMKTDAQGRLAAPKATSTVRVAADRIHCTVGNRLYVWRFDAVS